MDYNSLIAGKTTSGSIKRWVNNDAVDSAVVVEEAQSWILERLRVREMLTSSTSLTMVVGTPTVTPPSNCISPLYWQITGPNAYGAIEKRDAVHVESNIVFTSTASRTNARPTMFYYDGSVFQLDSPPDTAYTSRLLYYAKAATLVTTGTGTTNILTANYPRIMRQACMAMANEFLKDKAEKEYWLSLAADGISQANAQAEMNLEMGGIPDAMPPGPWGN